MSQQIDHLVDGLCRREHSVLGIWLLGADDGASETRERGPRIFKVMETWG